MAILGRNAKKTFIFKHNINVVNEPTLVLSVFEIWKIVFLPHILTISSMISALVLLSLVLTLNSWRKNPNIRHVGGERAANMTEPK